MVNTWLIHLKKVQQDNPNLTYRECMKKGKLSYKKQAGKGILSSAWNGIKKIGKVVAIGSIGIPLAALGSQIALMAFLSAQPDNGISIIKKIEDKITQNGNKYEQYRAHTK